MLFKINRPPQTTGRYTKDIPAIYTWCAKFATTLERALNKLDDANISSVGVSKLAGDIDPAVHNIKGGTMEYDGETLVITGGTVRIQNADGTAYIELAENGSLNIVGATIT
ncbi:MAG: hypothetical protein ACI4DP_13235 [Candidatus Ornithomonoglobus sp.]